MATSYAESVRTLPRYEPGSKAPSVSGVSFFEDVPAPAYDDIPSSSRLPDIAEKQTDSGSLLTRHLRKAINAMQENITYYNNHEALLSMRATHYNKRCFPDGDDYIPSPKMCAKTFREIEGNRMKEAQDMLRVLEPLAESVDGVAAQTWDDAFRQQLLVYEQNLLTGMQEEVRRKPRKTSITYMTLVTGAERSWPIWPWYHLRKGLVKDVISLPNKFQRANAAGKAALINDQGSDINKKLQNFVDNRDWWHHDTPIMYAR